MRPQSAQKRRRQAQLEMPSKWLSPLSDNRPGRPVRGDRRGMVAGKTRFVYLRAGSCKPAEGYCTLAVTEAAPFRVKVHVFVLLPPLEHAPDQITSRPFVALSVIEVPTVNEAEPLLPVATLMPAGVELTRSPPRPVAVTLSVALWPPPPGGAAGVTVSVAFLVVPL